MDARHGEFVDPQCRPDRASSPRQHEQQDQAETSTVAMEQVSQVIHREVRASTIVVENLESECGVVCIATSLAIVENRRIAGTFDNIHGCDARIFKPHSREQPGNTPMPGHRKRCTIEYVRGAFSRGNVDSCSPVEIMHPLVPWKVPGSLLVTLRGRYRAKLANDGLGQITAWQLCLFPRCCCTS